MNYRRRFNIKKIIITLLSLLLFTSAGCDTPKEAAHTPSPSPKLPKEFFTEKLFTQYLNDMYGQSSALIQPVAYIPLSRWLPEEPFRSSKIEGQNKYLFLLNDSRNRNFMFSVQYDPAFSHTPLQEILNKNDVKKNINHREETISSLSGDLLTCSDKSPNAQQFTICGIPVLYSFSNHILNEVIINYNGFLLQFIFNYDPPPVVWDTAASPYLLSVRNLANPATAEQEIQRLTDIIDSHLKQY